MNITTIITSIIALFSSLLNGQGVPPQFAQLSSVGSPETFHARLSSAFGGNPSLAVESHKFHGSGSEIAAFQAWFNGKPFVRPSVATNDLTQLVLPSGQTANAGDIVYKHQDGSFSTNQLI